MRPIKVVCVGDARSGKTSVLDKLIYNYDLQACPECRCNDCCCNEAFFPIQKMTVVNHEGNDSDVTLEFHDTPGQAEYIPAIREHYPGTSVFMVCFKIGCPEDDSLSESNATEAWIREIGKHAPGTPMILVGCQKEIADSQSLETARKWGTHGAKELGVKSYVACSAYTGEGVMDVLDAVVEAHTSQMKIAPRSASENTSFILTLRDSITKMVCGGRWYAVNPKNRHPREADVEERPRLRK